MSDKALISEYTWRSLEMQKAAFPEMPHYMLPNQESELLRPTRRERKDVFHAMSLAVIAKREPDFRDFVRMVQKIGATIETKDGCIFPHTKMSDAVEVWKIARRSASGRIGAQISADRKRAKSAAGIAFIKDLWPQPSNVYSTRELLDKAGVSLNTAKAHLGKRPIAQYNYQAAQKRKERRNAKN